MRDDMANKRERERARWKKKERKEMSSKTNSLSFPNSKKIFQKLNIIHDSLSSMIRMLSYISAVLLTSMEGNTSRRYACNTLKQRIFQG